MKNYAYLVAALSLSGLFSTPAVADVILPSTILDVTLGADNADESQANLFSANNGTIASELPTGGVSVTSPDATGTASASVSGVPNPTIITNASGPSSYAGNLDASDIFLEYYYEANGPANVQVPIFITGNANLEAVNSASGEIVVQTNGVRFAECYDPTDPIACTSGGEDYYGSSFPIDLGTSITSDTPYAISIIVDAASGCCVAQYVTAAGTASSSSASLDPVISIDPTFEDVGEFTVDVSPDVGNSPAAVTVPEPGSLALFGISLVSLGIARRKMRT